MGTRKWPIGFPTQIITKATGLPDVYYTSWTAGEYNRGGINNPYWKQTIFAGGNASSAMTVDIDMPWSATRSTARLWYSTYPFGPSQTKQHSTEGTRPPPAGFAYPNNLADWEHDIQVKASIKFLNRLREEDHRFQGGVFFGEIVPTIKMLMRPFGSLRDGIGRYYSACNKRVRGRPRKSWNRIVGDTWLEYSFGWQPLLADIQDASLAAINIYANLRKKRVNGLVRGQINTPTNTVRNYIENLMIYDVFFYNDVRYSVKYYGGLTPLPNADKGLPFLKRIADMSSFNLAAFIPTVWELIPYSFLIDYFSNVGDVLQAYATDTSTLAWLSMVEQRQSGQTIRWDYLHEKTYKYIVGSQQGFTQTRCKTEGTGALYGSSHRQILRWSHGSLTYPGLEFQLPFSRTKFANMGALLMGSRKIRG